MPYELQEEGNGKYYVVNTMTGKKYSSEPEDEEQATRHMRALRQYEKYAPAVTTKGGNKMTPEQRGKKVIARDVASMHLLPQHPRDGILRGMNRLEQTGSPLRPEQHFTNLYSNSAVVTQFPIYR